MIQNNIRNLVILPEYSWVHDLFFNIDMDTRSTRYDDIIWILENNDLMQLMNVAFSLDVQGSGFYLEVALCMMAVAVKFIKDNKFDEFMLLKEISPLEDYSRIHACRYLKQIISLTETSSTEKQILRLSLLALQKG